MAIKRVRDVKKEIEIILSEHEEIENRINNLIKKILKNKEKLDSDLLPHEASKQLMTENNDILREVCLLKHNSKMVGEQIEVLVLLHH